MRILIVSNNLAIGGKERQIVELINAVSNLNNITIGLILRENLIEFDLKGIDKQNLYLPSARLSFKAFVKFQAKAINLFKPDILHTWEAGTALSSSLLKVFLYRKVGIVDGTIRFAKKFPFWYKYFWILRFNHLVANRVIANSFEGLKAFNYNLSKKKQVIYNGLNMDRIIGNKKSIAFNGLVLGMVANFTGPKDYFGLIECCNKIIRNTKIQLKVYCIGGGPEIETVKSTVDDEFTNNFIFTGLVENPEKYTANFDIGILLSKKGHSEGMSNAIMEYMALGLPVICTDTGGNSELVKEGINGYLVSHAEYDKVYERIVQLAGNEQLRIKMGESSKKLATSMFDPDKMCRKYMNLYTSIIKS